MGLYVLGWAGYACKIDGRMYGELYVKIMEEDLKANMNYYGKTP